MEESGREAAAPPAPPVDGGPVRLSVLGEPSLTTAAGVVAFPTGRPGRLLTSLLLADGHVVAADRLVDDVWGSELPADARASLHTTVGRVRRALGPHGGRLARHPHGYSLRTDGWSIDAHEFAAAAEAGRSVAELDAALALWRGKAWTGYTDDLARGPALRLEESRLAVRERRAAALLEAGRTTEAAGALRELVSDEPLREGSVALLMRALHRLGDVGGALAAYTAHRDLLADELGLDPSAGLNALHRDVLRRLPEGGTEIPAAPAGPPSPATPAAHADPTISRDDGSPAGRAPDDAPSVPPLHGRDAQVGTLEQMLAAHRCVSVVGPGGVGKTSIAAHVVRGHPHWWVDLASVDDPASVGRAVADALGVEVFPGGTMEAALRRRLESVRGVIVLDNCEHLLAGAAALVAEALAVGPGLRVLTTSRQRLGVVGEFVCPLPPLQLPAPGVPASTSPGVALFLERARAAAPDLPADEETLAVAADVVRRLDGLPLAIELAAGRVGSVTLPDLRDRLADHLDLLRGDARHHRSRQRTVTSTIAWSYDLLDDDERRGFTRLSVFTGAFDLAAAEAVLGERAVEVVAGLTERSLLVRPGSRGRGEYRMLETLRAFARARVAAEELATAQQAHARWVVEAVRVASRALDGPDERAADAALELLVRDAAAAHHYALGRGDAATAAEILGLLHRWAYVRLRADVLARSLDILALGAAGDLAEVHCAAAAHAWLTSRFDDARRHAERALALAQDGSVEAGRAVDALSDVALAVGRPLEALRLGTEGYERAVSAGSWTDAAFIAVNATVAVAYSGGDATGWLTRLEDAARRSDNPTCRAFAAFARGEVLAEHSPHEALAALEEAQRLATEVGNRLVDGLSRSVDTAVRARSAPLERDTVERCCGAVEHWLASGNDNLFLTCLRNLVPLLDRLGCHRPLVELVSATHTELAYGAEAERLEAGLSRARAGLGEDEYAAARRTGAARSTVEAGRAVLVALHAARP